MTINQLALALVKEQDESSDNTEFVSLVEDWIRDAIDEVSSVYEWRLFRKTVNIITIASQSEYDLPVGIREIRGIRHTIGDDPVEYVDAPRLYGVAEDLENLGKPLNWYWGNSTLEGTGVSLTIRFDPVPDDAYSLDVQVIFMPLEAPIPVQFIPFQNDIILCIKHRARAYILANDKDYDGAQMYLQMFFNKISELIGKETSPSASNIRLQPRDISKQGSPRYARLDPTHFRN
jgi:hypothetical protein